MLHDRTPSHDLLTDGVVWMGVDWCGEQAGLFPIRWTAPEAASSMRFTQASDIWSYGIFAVEVFLDGGQPYGGVKVCSK